MSCLMFSTPLAIAHANADPPSVNEWYYQIGGDFYRSGWTPFYLANSSWSLGWSEPLNGTYTQVAMFLTVTHPVSYPLDVGYTDSVQALNTITGFKHVSQGYAVYTATGNISLQYNIFIDTENNYMGATPDPLNPNGSFFVWNNTATLPGIHLMGLDDDVYGVCVSGCGGGQSGQLTFSDSTQFYMIPSGLTYTAAQLKAGDDTTDNVTGSDPAALFVQFYDNGGAGTVASHASISLGFVTPYPTPGQVNSAGILAAAGMLGVLTAGFATVAAKSYEEGNTDDAKKLTAFAVAVGVVTVILVAAGI
jgi:hypothetical protein